MCAFVWDRMHKHKWVSLRVCSVADLLLNTQRPRELPRAERTASACVLVPSKQGNLENTKGAANKHNFIPPSSYTWLVCHCVRVHMCVSLCQSLCDLTREGVCIFLHVFVCVYLSWAACVCNHLSFYGTRRASAVGKLQVCVPSHHLAVQFYPLWKPDIDLYCKHQCMETSMTLASSNIFTRCRVSSFISKLPHVS